MRPQARHPRLTPPTLPMPWPQHLPFQRLLYCPHNLSCYKSTISAQGEAWALHHTQGMGSPSRVFCPKQPHLRVAQSMPHTAPSHDWAHARDPVHTSGSLLSATLQPNRLHTSHTAEFPPWPQLDCQQGTISEHTGRGGTNAFKGSSQDGACRIWTSTVWAQDLSMTEKKAGLTIIVRVLETFFSCPQRLVRLLLCIKQSFSEKSKLLIQPFRNAAVQGNNIEPLQQNPRVWRAANSSSKYNRLKTIFSLHEFLYTSVP